MLALGWTLSVPAVPTVLKTRPVAFVAAAAVRPD